MNNHIQFKWSIATINDVASKIHYGYTTSAKNNNVGPKLLRITDIQGGKVNWNEVPYCKISKEEIDKYLLMENDIVFARTGATVGKSFLIRGKIPDSIFASYLIRLQLSDQALPQFIFLFFQSNDYWTQIKNSSAGIGQPNVNAQKLGNIKVPLPPLLEQQKIVAKIEELFRELDNGIEQLKKAKGQIKTYRQAVLASAFSGKLTHAHLNPIKVPYPVNKAAEPEIPYGKELPEGWRLVKLGEVIELISGQHILKNNYNFSRKGIPYLTGPIDFGGYFPTISRWTMKPKAIAKKHDVLLTVKGAGVGKLNISNIEEMAISRQLMAIRSKNYFPLFLFYFLKSKFYEFQKLGLGSTVPGIDRNSILNFLAILPPSEDQKQIVEEIEKRFSEADNLEKAIDESIVKAETLRQSILKQAFEGRLV